MRVWFNEKKEVVGWLLMLLPLAVIAGATVHSVWRGDPLDLWPLVLLALVGAVLLVRGGFGGLRVGRNGIDFGEEE